MKPVSIIKSEAQYFAYCDEVEQLESMETKTKEIEDRVELLILLIEKWDQEHNELPELNPVEYLKLLMETNDLKNVDIQNKVGINKTTLSHILNYRRGFSKKNIRLLADFFKVTQDTFNKKYELKNAPKKKTKPQTIPTTKASLKRRKAMA
ncbi:MAG: type II toxin-antitoxin system HigA family antitoxin [Saprospiraceae bacterium]